MSKVTHILAAIEQGEPRAAEELLPLVYEELRSLAAQKLAQEAPGQTLQPTALVHEAYLRLTSSSESPTTTDVGATQVGTWNGRAHFFAAAAEAMRRILIERARRKQRLRHGGGRKRLELAQLQDVGQAAPDVLLALDDVLKKLCAEEPEVGMVVKLQFFCGFLDRGKGDDAQPLRSHGESPLGLCPRLALRAAEPGCGRQLLSFFAPWWHIPSPDVALMHNASTRSDCGAPVAGKRIKAVFDEAIEIEDLGQRAAFLDETCAGKPEVRARVEALLRAYAEAGGFLEGGNARPQATIDHTTDSPLGARTRERIRGEAVASIGAYKLLQLIGEGGMGSVWLAEQQEPIRRQVAMKILKAGMDSPQAVARFEAERQALALMDHPNIAKVLDAGALPVSDLGLPSGDHVPPVHAPHDSRPTAIPYFVMELVKGIPITKYCDERRLTPNERLQLFIQACQALQHAHQKGIIHRDVKPSNVLVAPYDGEPVVKVVDFGVAKAIGQRLTDHTMFTEFGAVVGTLEYMSPEQAELNNQDIDTRSDVYSLGILLYELLTGTTPLGAHVRKQTSVLELLRRIRDDEPQRPSTRLSSARDTLAAISAQRRMDPVALTRLMRGELDWIVMKALEKDRNRRYAMANDLAEDVARYLNDEPVAACPPTLGYRLGKFARRHKAPLAIATLFIVALIVGITGTTWGMIVAERARKNEMDRAEAERQAKEKEARARAVAEEAERHAIASEADTQAFSNFLVDDVLAVARPAGEQGGLGVDVTVKQALVAAADRISERFQGRPRAEALARHDLGVTFRLVGDPVRAVEQLEKAMALRKQVLPPDADETLVTMNSLSVAYRAAGKLDQALAIGRETLERTEKIHGKDHKDTLTSMNNLAVACHEAGQTDEAVRLMEEAYARSETVLGPDHPDTVHNLGNLATARQLAGDRAGAVPLQERVLEARRRLLGPEHPETLQTLGNLAAALRAMGKLERSVPLFEEALALRTKAQGADHPDTLFTAFNLAMNYVDAGRRDEAIEVIAGPLERARTSLPAGHPTRDFGVHTGAHVYERAGELAEAEALWREHADRQRAKYGPGSPQYAVVLSELGRVLISQGKWAEAEASVRASLAIRERVDPNSWTTFWARSQLGLALMEQKRPDAAEPLLLNAYDGIKARAAQAPMGGANELAETASRLARLYEALHQGEKAAYWRQVANGSKPGQ